MTTTLSQKERRLQVLVARHQVSLYFVGTFAISWTGALVVTAPALMGGDPLPKMAGLLMFPIMLLGPCLTGIILTRIAGGGIALKELFTQMRRIRLGHWYASLLTPPGMILIVLLSLKTFVSPVHSPNKFFVGIALAVIAGFPKKLGGWASLFAHCPHSVLSFQLRF